jgi:hypothetical protein
VEEQVMIDPKQAATVLLSAFWMLGTAGKFLACSRQEAAAATPKGQVVASASPSAGHAELHILKVTVDEQGFTPNGVTVKATEEPGEKQLLLEFTRVTDKTCAKEVMLPELGVVWDLPLNVPVRVPLPLAQQGQVSFQCAMGMHQGGVFID